MQKFFSHTFLQTIWRILPHPDPVKNEWAIELREITQKKVSFAILDLSRQELKWIVSPDGADWWTSMTGFAHDHIFLHHYRYPELPEPTDLSALSRETGDLVWTLPNYVLVRALDDPYIEVAGRQGDAFKYLKCDVERGEIIPGDYSFENEGKVIFKQPERYIDGNIYFGRLSAFLQTNFNVNNPICIDYLDRRPYMVFSYYIYEQDKIAQYLLIVTDKGKSLIHEMLSDERDGVGQSTILLKGSTLVYLKNSTEFKSLKLSQ